jgi:sulfite exporter TauE/SafE
VDRIRKKLLLGEKYYDFIVTASILITGFLTGAAGSLHCIGMCGPLSLALPVHHLGFLQKFLSLLLYQLGRVLTYTIIGFLFGFLGRRIYIAGYQHFFSIGAGIFILSLAALYFAGKRNLHWKPFNRFYLFIQQQLTKLLSARMSPADFFLTGIANGFLPCGMVYVALAATLHFESVTDSMLFMAMFGLGTLPAMLTIVFTGQLVKQEWRAYSRRLIPFFITTIGVLLILRGLNLDIPFISPELPQLGEKIRSCHP